MGMDKSLILLDNSDLIIGPGFSPSPEVAKTKNLIFLSSFNNFKISSFLFPNFITISVSILNLFLINCAQYQIFFLLHLCTLSHLDQSSQHATHQRMSPLLDELQKHF